MPVEPLTQTPGRAPTAPIAPPKTKPVPLLQQNGLSGDVNEFNERVQAVFQAHHAAFGTKPSPHLAYDLVRSNVPAQDFSRLFQVKSQQQARTITALHADKQKNPDDYFVTRSDGIIQPSTPLLRLFQNVPPPAEAKQITPALQKKYPMVMMGALPIPGVDGVFKALRELDQPDQTQVAQSPTDVGLGIPSQTAGLVGTSALTRTDAYRNRQVVTLKQAQVALNKQMGTSLPVTGVFNDDWVKTISNWQHTTDYFRKQLAFQAKQEGFGDNVGTYVKAWEAKQQAVKHGLYGHFVATMPLPLFGHGGFWQDAGSIGAYLKGSSSNPLNMGLHALTRSAGLTLDLIGGTVTQAKADAAAGTTLAAFAAGLDKPGTTYEDALQQARKQLHANPSYLRAFGFGHVPLNEPSWLRAIDQTTNVLGDLVLLRKPAFTGERIAAGDMAAARNSVYLNKAAGWSYESLAKYGQDGIGRAAARLEGSPGARAFVARAAPLVKQGVMSRTQFRAHVAELYATGKTTVTYGEKGSAQVTGSVLPSLGSARLPAPGKAGQWLLEQKHGLRDALDSFDASAGGSNSTLVNRSGALIQTVRSAVAHAAPQGATLGFFQDILPERVFNFVVKHKLGDDTVALANKLESDLVRFQGKQNVRGIQKIQTDLKSLYHDKYGQGKQPADDPFKAILETEAPSQFKFPSGETASPDEALTSVTRFTSTLNAGLNKTAKIHARIILSGLNPAALIGAAVGGAVGGPVGGLVGFGLLGPGRSLFWKHLIGDGLRAVVGGLGDALTPEVRAATKELKTLGASDVTVGRRYGALLERLRMGEINWALGRTGTHGAVESFRTADKFGSGNYMASAGDFLRRQLDSKALDAYRQGRLTQLVSTDRDFKGLWKAAEKDLRKTDPTATLTEADFAAVIAQRYKDIEKGLTAKGLTFDDAAAVLRANMGAKAGDKLGSWLEKNRVDIPVDHGQVQVASGLDALSSAYVGNIIMRPNKFWRKSLGETVLAKHYSDFRKAGFAETDAFEAASTLAERVVKYHMLDFANRLQVEQDLRWLSYFATKHRLYWKWVISTFARNPRYAAAVNDFEKTLNDHGGVSLPVHVAGTDWQIPLERLVWVPGREYDETSPLALGVWNFVKSGGSLDAAVKASAGTNGNILTRSDTAVVLGTKLLKIHTGNEAPTYNYARAGLDQVTKDTVTRALNEYQVEFFKEHGHYATEANAVKTVLLHQMGQEYWRANLPLPVVPVSDRTEQQALLAEYMTLVDPKARGKFLDKHPDLADHFGVYDDPRKFLHNREFFQRWTQALDAYHSVRRDLYAEAKRTGEWTVPMEQKRRDLNASLQKTRQKLLIEDAHSAGIDTKGGVPNGTTIKYGPWGRVVNRDPQFDPSHFLSATFPKLAPGSQDNIIGPLQRSLQNELSLLNDPQYVRAQVQTPAELKTLKREILQKLEVFKSYPSDALGKIRDTYQTQFVNKYWAHYDARVKEILTLSHGKRAAADAAFRAWRDSEDKPVTVDGVKFPAPLRMAWATLDPKTRTERLSYLASKPFTSLADYELDLLDVTHPSNVSVALAAIDQAKQEYRAQHPGESVSKEQLLNVAKQINKQKGYEGFFRYYTQVLTAPGVRQFEQTSLYREMPEKALFDEVIRRPALEVAAQIKQGNRSYYLQQWAAQIDAKIVPWLAEPDQKPLRDYLALFGPDFLNGLPG